MRSGLEFVERASKCVMSKLYSGNGEYEYIHVISSRTPQIRFTQDESPYFLQQLQVSKKSYTKRILISMFSLLFSTTILSLSILLQLSLSLPMKAKLFELKGVKQDYFFPIIVSAMMIIANIAIQVFYNLRTYGFRRWTVLFDYFVQISSLLGLLFAGFAVLTASSGFGFYANQEGNILESCNAIVSDDIKEWFCDMSVAVACLLWIQLVLPGEKIIFFILIF